jgi:HD-GYP domain-containing protein (c-di-GMP phosphodiesterase class II)
MYVVLPLSWLQHPFLTNRFVIESEEEIKKIKGLKVKEIQVDLSKSRTVGKSSPVVSPESLGSRETGASRKIIPEDLRTTIYDKKLPPEEKSRLVKHHSITMMKNLLDHPTAENIKEARKGISDIVNLILTEDTTLHYLLNITSHDFYTYTHSVTVGILGVALAKSLFIKSDRHDIQELGAGFFLHDLGKVNINQAIINKPGKLTEEEMQEMRRHPGLGYKLLRETKQLTEESKTIVLQHHERIDGKGYPRGLQRQEIHIYGRICAIADVYDALTSDRPYRQKLSPFAALKIMREEMIEHFQNDLFERFVLLFKKTS